MSLPASEQVPSSALRTAERILSRHFGGRVRIRSTDILHTTERSQVARCHLDGAPVTAAVILKRALEMVAGSGDSGSASALGRYANDYAGAGFVASLDLDPPLGPRPLGGDREGRLLLLEDLGDGECLGDVLVGADPARATAALEAYIRGLGRLHSASAGRSEIYERLRETVQPGRRSLAEYQDRVRHEIEKIAATFEELQFEWTPALVDDVQQVAAALIDPGPFLTYTHGDACAVNNRLREGAAVFFDFESGGLGHALIDEAYLRVPFPTCAYAARLPGHLLDSLDGVYRAALVKGVPEAGDDGRFGRAQVEALAFWLLAGANSMLPRALRFEQRWGLATYRQRLLRLLEVFSESSLRYGHLSALGAFASITLEKLRAKWPEVREMAMFPAFDESRDVASDIAL